MSKSDVPQNNSPIVDKVVPPCNGMLGRRHGSPEVMLDDKIGAESERMRLERIQNRSRQEVGKEVLRLLDK